MSYTNQTQHYGLPQYVATDVPAYLTDYNGAMAKIDQGMNAAKTQADSAATAAGQAANDIAALQSTVGTQAAQISAAAQAAASAQTTANAADEKADVNTESINGLDDRVTALEQGGMAFEYDDVVTDNSWVAQIPTKAGYLPVAAVPTVASNGVACHIAYYPSGDSIYQVRFTRMVSSGSPTAATGNWTARVYYMPVS